MTELATDDPYCPLCKSNSIFYDFITGETVCNDCGYVYRKELLDRSPEWRAFNQVEADKLSRVGLPLTLRVHDRGLSTVIGTRNIDHKGNKLPPKRRNTFYRLRKWDNRSKNNDSLDRNLILALRQISQMCNKLCLPNSVMETSASIYREALRKDCIKGRTIKGTAAVSVYTACRLCRVSRNLADISQVSNIDKKNLARTYRYIIQHLDTEIPQTNIGKIISTLIQKLELSGNVEKISLDLLEIASRLKLTNGKRPSGIAGSIVYVASQIMSEKRPQKVIASKSQVTSVTIRNRYKEFLDHIEIEIRL